MEEEEDRLGWRETYLVQKYEGDGNEKVKSDSKDDHMPTSLLLICRVRHDGGERNRVGIEWL